MILVDVNVIVYAHRSDSTDHERYRSWLTAAVNGDEPVGLPDLVLSGALRILTHPKIFDPPTDTDAAANALERLREQPGVVSLVPGTRHWSIFVRLLRETGARGNLIPDAYLAAIALETGSTFITTDGDYARFDGLRSRHPLA